MNIELLAQVQPYIDEYCKVKKIYDVDRKECPMVGYAPPELANKLLAHMNKLDAAEKAIMQILIDSNCKEIEQ